MGMPQNRTDWTAELVRALPADGKRYEAVDGVLLVTPSPGFPHQRAVRELLMVLAPFVAEARLGEVLPSPSDIELDPGSLVQPDVFVLGLTDGQPPRDWNTGAPLLQAIEVVSPSSARADRGAKRRRYQRAGVPEYWIVDLDARVIERWRPDDLRPEVLTDSIQWRPVDAAAPLTIDLQALFTRIGEPA